MAARLFFGWRPGAVVPGRRPRRPLPRRRLLTSMVVVERAAAAKPGLAPLDPTAGVVGQLEGYRQHFVFSTLVDAGAVGSCCCASSMTHHAALLTVPTACMGAAERPLSRRVWLQTGPGRGRRLGWRRSWALAAAT